MIRARPNVTIRAADGLRRYRNSMTQAGLDWLLDLAAGLAPAGITHIAVGDDGAPVSLGDAQLRHELARKAVTGVTRDVGAAVAEVFFAQAEANFHWAEVGLIAGGTDVAGTGILIARAIVDEAKDARRTATITWEIGVQNV